MDGGPNPLCILRRSASVQQYRILGSRALWYSRARNVDLTPRMTEEQRVRGWKLESRGNNTFKDILQSFSSIPLQHRFNTASIPHQCRFDTASIISYQGIGENCRSRFTTSQSLTLAHISAFTEFRIEQQQQPAQNGVRKAQRAGIESAADNRAQQSFH